MNNPWKLATIGIALTGVTAMTTGLTTAYMLRPTPTAEAQLVPATRQVVETRAPRVTQAVYRPSTVQATRVSSAPVDCQTGGDRAWRIAKPGLVGTLLGAGLGAAGGAIADGGKAAGKGAMIGGLAGAALGTGYGAYKTNKECGTIFGGGAGFANGAAVAAAPRDAQTQTAFHGGSADRITVYGAR